MVFGDQKSGSLSNCSAAPDTIDCEAITPSTTGSSFMMHQKIVYWRLLWIAFMADLNMLTGVAITTAP